MVYRVIQWATGGVGRPQLQEVVQRADLELAGLFVYGEDKVGVDAGTLCGLPPTGILATNDKEKIFAMSADVVLHAASKAHKVNSNTEDILRLLESGKNVISTTSYAHLPTYSLDTLNKFETACNAGNSSFFAAGENPGFMMQRLAATLTTLSKRVDHIILEEYYQTAWHPSRAMMHDFMGMGKPAKEVSLEAPLFKAVNRAYEQELNATADVLGIRLEKIVPSVEVATLDYDLDIAMGRVEKNTVAGQRWSWSGYWHGKPYLTIRETWIVTRDIPQWKLEKLTNWVHDDYIRIMIEGLPSYTFDLALTLDTDLPYMKGISPAHLMIAMTGVRAIADVCKSPPGVVHAPIFGVYKPL